MAGAVEPASPPRDTAVQEHITRKLQQKQAYKKWAGFPLWDLKPGTYVYVRPPPTSSSKAWNPGEIAGPASPQSYMINSRGRTLHQNCVQIQQAPSTGRDCTNSTPSEPVVPDLLVPNTMTAQCPNNIPRESQRISPTLIQPNEESTISSPSLLAIPEDRQIHSQQPHVEPFLSSSLSKEPRSSPARPESLTVTRSGGIVWRPAIILSD